MNKTILPLVKEVRDTLSLPHLIDKQVSRLEGHLHALEPLDFGNPPEPITHSKVHDSDPADPVASGRTKPAVAKWLATLPLETRQEIANAARYVKRVRRIARQKAPAGSGKPALHIVPGAPVIAPIPAGEPVAKIRYRSDKRLSDDFKEVLETWNITAAEKAMVNAHLDTLLSLGVSVNEIPFTMRAIDRASADVLGNLINHTSQDLQTYFGALKPPSRLAIRKACMETTRLRERLEKDSRLTGEDRELTERRDNRHHRPTDLHQEPDYYKEFNDASWGVVYDDDEKPIHYFRATRGCYLYTASAADRDTLDQAVKEAVANKGEGEGQHWKVTFGDDVDLSDLLNLYPREVADIYRRDREVASTDTDD